MPQVFNALSGTEMIEVIKDLIGKKLESTGEFKPHNTYPWSRVSFAVGIVAYPQQGMEDTDPKIKITGTEIITDDAGKLVSIADVKGDPHVISVKDSVVLDTPDKARVETSLPVPTIIEGPGGQKIDKLILKSPLPIKKEGK